MVETPFPDTVRWPEPDGGLFTWLTFPPGFGAGAFVPGVTSSRSSSSPSTPG